MAAAAAPAMTMAVVLVVTVEAEAVAAVMGAEAVTGAEVVMEAEVKVFRKPWDLQCHICYMRSVNLDSALNGGPDSLS